MKKNYTILLYASFVFDIKTMVNHNTIDDIIFSTSKDEDIVVKIPFDGSQEETLPPKTAAYALTSHIHNLAELEKFFGQIQEPINLSFFKEFITIEPLALADFYMKKNFFDTKTNQSIQKKVLSVLVSMKEKDDATYSSYAWNIVKPHILQENLHRRHTRTKKITHHDSSDETDEDLPEIEKDIIQKQAEENIQIARCSCYWTIVSVITSIIATSLGIAVPIILTR